LIAWAAPWASGITQTLGRLRPNGKVPPDAASGGLPGTLRAAVPMSALVRLWELTWTVLPEARVRW
jgi:hypothetical protein